MIEALIAAGASLLGGAMSRPPSAKSTRYGDVAGIFKAAEEFKFSPFALLGSSAPSPGMPNPMGAAIADAGLLLADAKAKQKTKALEEERLRLENEKLRREVNQMVLRPKVATPRASIGRVNAPKDPVLPDDPQTGPHPMPDPRLDRGTGIYLGQWWKPAPNFSPASVAEEEYGDIAQEFFGAAKFGADIGYNAGRARNWVNSKIKGKGPVMTINGKEYQNAKTRKVWHDDGTYSYVWPK